MMTLARSAAVGLMIGTLVQSCALAAGVKDRCTVDGDCTGDRVCQDGICGPTRAAADASADAGDEDVVACASSCGDAAAEGGHLDSGPDRDATTPAGVVGQSCSGVGGGKKDCGPGRGESCCTALPVAGGSFSRSYDAVTFTDATASATVSSFVLDKFEITVGRFREFTRAVTGGWRPQVGEGKHSYLPSGGLDNGAEVGWDPTWTSSIVTSAAAWDAALACTGNATWTSTPGANEALPITCASWIDLYAFCIWDGGFLPTEAEWDYAAAGGSEQRVYPWSAPPSSTAIDCTRANHAPCGSAVAFAGSTTAGRGKWGHADLAGNVWERTLDVYAAYSTPSLDAAFLSGTDRTLRGGSYVSSASATTLTASFRNHAPDVSRDSIVGGRCAYAP